MNENIKNDIVKISLALFFAVISFFMETPALKTSLLLTAYAIVGYEIIINAYKSLKNGGFLDENFLMSIASFGAFMIGEQIEAVAIMLFYSIGEAFEDYSVNKSRKSIQEAMDLAPEYANLKTDGKTIKVDPNSINIDDIIVIKPGERVPLDGVIVSGSSTLDTSALTGESLPQDATIGDEILSGVININGVLEVRVTSKFENSTVSRILELVEDASSKKSTQEKFITKFARIYTPIVVSLALIIAFIPPIFIGDFKGWFYKALIFLVVSCPCALVVSVPLSFFGGIGGASKKGILIKGSNYLESLSRVKTFVFDKTGTLTKGKFKVSEIKNESQISKDELLKLAAHSQIYSTHPISKSIINAYNGVIDETLIKSVEEISGHGIRAIIGDKEILIGNKKLLSKFQLPNTDKTATFMAINDKFVGYITFVDELRDGANELISWLKKESIKTVMITGDKENVASNLANELKFDSFYAEQLPADKVVNLEKLLLQKPKNATLAYIGDGINDAPVLARADVGIAMLGADAAMEAGDIVLMDNNISKIKSAILIAKKTLGIAYQNIIFAIGIKILVIVLAVLGLANIWMAIFADVGVTILVILNSFRTFAYSRKI